MVKWEKGKGKTLQLNVYVLEANWLVASNVLDFLTTAYKKAAKGRKRDVE